MYKKVWYNRNSYCMIQSANQKQEMKSVSHPLQTCSKYFGPSSFGSGNKCCPANESMVCTNIILFLFESTVNLSYLKRVQQCGCNKGRHCTYHQFNFYNIQFLLVISLHKVYFKQLINIHFTKNFPEELSLCL